MITSEPQRLKDFTDKDLENIKKTYRHKHFIQDVQKWVGKTDQNDIFKPFFDALYAKPFYF